MAWFDDQTVLHAPSQFFPKPLRSPKTPLQSWPPHEALPGRHVREQCFISWLPTIGTCCEAASIRESSKVPGHGAKWGHRIIHLMKLLVLFLAWLCPWLPRHSPGASSSHGFLPARSLEVFALEARRVY